MPSKYFTIHPYTRRGFSAVIANKLIEKDVLQESDSRGKLKWSREPFGWEPNETWSLNKLRFFINLVDKTIPIEVTGLTEAQIKRGYDEGRLSSSSVERLIDEAKVKLLNVCHFLVCDPRRPFPIQESFESMWEKERLKNAPPEKKKVTNATKSA
jgi:hypothetical protein